MADDNHDAAELLASGGGGARPGGGGTRPGGGDARPVADDNAEKPVARGTCGGAANAANDSQTGQILPVHGVIAGTTLSRMVA